MFPLKIRRKYVRIYEQNIPVKMSIKKNIFNGTLTDISASGCKIDCDGVVLLDSELKAEFVIDNVCFSVKLKHVRDNAYTFIDITDDMQEQLNKLIIKEYFKDTPELIEK